MTKTANGDDLNTLIHEGDIALAAGEKRHAVYRALPRAGPFFDTDDADDWTPDAADPFAKGGAAAARPAAAAPAGLLAALQKKR